MAQLSYSIEHKQAYPGGRADSGMLDAVAAQNDGAAAIAFGLGAIAKAQPSDQGPIDMLSVRVPQAADTEALFAGVVLYDAVHESGYGSQVVTGVDVGNPMTLIRKGRIFVVAEDAVDPTKPVYLRLAANGAGTAAGQFRGTADAANTIQLARARWAGTRNTDGLAALDLNYP